MATHTHTHTQNEENTGMQIKMGIQNYYCELSWRFHTKSVTISEQKKEEVRIQAINIESMFEPL